MSQSWSKPVTSQRDWNNGSGQERMVVVMPRDGWENYGSSVKTSDDLKKRWEKKNTPVRRGVEGSTEGLGFLRSEVLEEGRKKKKKQHHLDKKKKKKIEGFRN